MKKIFFAGLSVLYSFALYGQMNYVPFMPKTFRVQDNLFTTIPGAGSSPYHISNGMYDEMGNLLFYTHNEFVLSATSVLANNDLNNSTGDITDEVIVPKPGSCNEFYIIYVNYASPTTTSLRYAVVTVSGATITVAPFTDLLVENFHHGSIAVSKRLTTANRYLFYGSQTGIRRFLVSNTGIGSQSSLISTSVLANELELYESTAGWKLAWAGNTTTGFGNTISVLPLTTSGAVSGALTTTTIGGTLNTNSKIRGLEFLNASIVFAAGFYGPGHPSNGIYRVTLGSGTVTFVPGSAQYGLSQIEKYGNLFYALGYTTLGGSATLGKFLVSNLLPVAGSPVVSNFSSDSYYFMPRGVDLENYNTILRGNQPATTASWPVNPCPGDVITATVTNVQAGTTYSWWQKCGAVYTQLGTGTSKTLSIQANCSYFVRAVSVAGCSSIGFPTSSMMKICPVLSSGQKHN